MNGTSDWIFHSVPRRYKLPGALIEARQHGNVLTFEVTKYEERIEKDHTVYICFGGPRRGNPGLYATAIVLTAPALIDCEAWERKYEKEPFPEKAIRVRLKIERYLEPPVPRSDIIGLPKMAPTTFVKNNAQGTNFPLTPEQAMAIEELIPAPRALGVPTPAGNRSGRTLLVAPRFGPSKPDRLQNIHEAYLEELIASDLDQIEPGLTLIGRQRHAGAAGRIDLLCESSVGDIVVVELKRMGARAAGVVQQTMAYVGWARENLAGPNQQVRGIIVGGKPDTKLQYAVDGIPNLEFRSLSVSIRGTE